MDFLCKFKNTLEFCLTGSTGSIRRDYKVKNAVEMLEKQPDNSKAIRMACLDYKNIILGCSENITIDILNLLKEIDFISVNKIDIINNDNIRMVDKSNNLKVLNIPNNVLNEFNDIIYMNGGSMRDKRLLEIFRSNDIKYDFRIAKGLIYGLNDKSTEIRNIVIGILLSFDIEYIPYFEIEVNNLLKNNPQNANRLKKIIETISGSVE